ncbi:MAG: sulfite exporter TauE/SafE family protein [Bacillota bacterium]
MNWLLMVIYFAIAISATTVGALTGMGGGVIIKPVLDMIGGYDVATIGILSCVTVFAMSVSSIVRKVMQKSKFPVKLALYLSVGSMLGGLLGQNLLDHAIEAMGSGVKVTILQNVLLAILILGVFIYMLKKENVPDYDLEGMIPSVLCGVFLGTVSSFLGIGGGPINVAILIFLFPVDTKDATICSIITIFFAQISKILTVAFTTGFAIYDLSMLPAMVIGGVVGGLIGASLNKKVSIQKVELWFNIVQIVVLLISVYNIVSNVMAL